MPKTRALTVIALVCLVNACATISQLTSLRHVSFSLSSVSDPVLAGVDLSRVRSYDDLGIIDVGRVAAALLAEHMPLALTINVRAENPSSNSVQARLQRLEWTLLVDNRDIVSGVVNETILLQPGEPKTIPIAVNFDVFDFFSGGAQDLVEVSLAVAGYGTERKEVALRATPIIETPVGPIRYPQPITIRAAVAGS